MAALGGANHTPWSMPTPIQILRSYEVCGDALRFAEDYDDPQEAWVATVRGDWLLFAVGGGSGTTPRTEAREKAARLMIEVSRLSIASAADVDLTTQFLDLMTRWLDDEEGVTEEAVVALLDAVDEAEGESGQSVSWSAGWYAYTDDDPVRVRADAMFLGQTYCEMGGTLDIGDTEYDARNSQLADLVRSRYPGPPTLELSPTGPTCTEA